MVKVIFQRSVETGRVPRDWNDANVFPLLKKDDKSIANCSLKLQFRLPELHSISGPGAYSSIKPTDSC